MPIRVRGMPSAEATNSLRVRGRPGGKGCEIEERIQRHELGGEFDRGQAAILGEAREHLAEGDPFGEKGEARPNPAPTARN